MTKYIKNKGIVLSEVLCYISIFSMIMLVVLSYTILINKSGNKKFIDKCLELQKLIYDIEDTMFLVQEDLYIKTENNVIYLYGKNSDSLYLTLSENVIYSEVMQRTMEVGLLELEYFIENNFLVLRNSEKNITYVLNMECKK